MPDQSEDALDLPAIAAEVAVAWTDVAEAERDGRLEYSRRGTAFARVRPDRLEVRLPPDIAEAALRTPDTSAGEGGWTVFAPTSHERHVADRAEAWLVTAHRHAGDDV